MGSSGGLDDGDGLSGVRFQLRWDRPPCAFHSLPGAALPLSSSELTSRSWKRGTQGASRPQDYLLLQEILSCWETTCREQIVLCSGEGLQRRGGTLAVLQEGLGYQVSVSCLSKGGLGGRATLDSELQGCLCTS